MVVNFVQDYIMGVCNIEDIDSYIQKWHESDSTLELYEFLGMAESDYMRWVENPICLQDILNMECAAS